MLNIDMDLKVKLYKEYLDNGGVEKIVFPELLKELLKVKQLPNGKVNTVTISSIVNAAMLAYVASQLDAPFTTDKYLAEYQTILQKSIFFDQQTIDTKEQFEDLFDKYKNTNNILYRGLNEAKYRLYSSLQRSWITRHFPEKNITFSDYLKVLLENARQVHGGVLSNYFKIANFDPNNDLAILSFLQHYGCSTPLLDWTYSFANALYFATERISISATTWEVDQYLCVYFMQESDLEKGSLMNIIHTGLNEYREKYKEDLKAQMLSGPFSKEQIEYYFSDDLIDRIFDISAGQGVITELTKIENLLTAPLLYFSDFKNEKAIRYSVNNSLNIVNQRGAFTWNADPVMPLEHIANEIVKKENPNADYHFCQCININKKIAPFIKEKLTELGVTKDFIYPDPQEIAKQSFEKTLAKFNLL
jgi:FRG domain